MKDKIYGIMVGVVFVSLLLMVAVPTASADEPDRETKPGSSSASSKHSWWESSTMVSGGAKGYEVSLSWGEKDGHGASVAMGQIVTVDYYKVQNPNGGVLWQEYVQSMAFSETKSTRASYNKLSDDHRWHADNDIGYTNVYQHGEYKYHETQCDWEWTHETRGVMPWDDWEVEDRGWKEYNVKYAIHLVGEIA